MKMTTFIIGIVIVILVMTSFGLVLSDMTAKYPSSDYSDKDMVAFQQMEEIDNLTSQIKNRVENQSTDRSVTDVIGGFIADGKDTLLLSGKSYDLLETMSDEGMSRINLPNTFKVAFYVIILVLVFVGIILAAILGRQL